MSETKKFDLVLSYLFFRMHPFYLNIIKYLSKRYSIGLLVATEASTAGAQKSWARGKETDELFKQCCVDLGAQLISVDQKIHARVFLIALEPVNPPDEYLRKFRQNISYDRIFALPRVTGTKMTEFSAELNIEKYFVEYKEWGDRIAQRAGFQNCYENKSVSERHMPYKKYPVFSELTGTIDYLVAYPSPVQFESGKERFLKEKYLFMKNLCQLLLKIPKENTVVIKYHNLTDRQRYFAKFRFRGRRVLTGAADLSAFWAGITPVLKEKFYSFAANCLNAIVVNSYASLEELTPFHNFPLQVFLPAVNKGIIGGYSGVSFYALAENIPYYNCDPRPREKASTAEYHDFFQVDPCGGQLLFDEANYKRIRDDYRSVDFIADLEKVLSA